MRLATRFRRLARDEQGFAMIFALMVLVISSLLVAAALAATTEDSHLNQTYLNQQKAYVAAQAGIDEYKYQLNTNPNYWIACPKAENVTVPGTTDETYTVKTLHSEGHTQKECEEGKKQTAIIEAANSASGTFRIESTGTAGAACRAKEACTRTIVATLKHPGFLNYVFLSNFEVEDPSTIEPVPTNCAHYYKERLEKGWTGECPSISWIGPDELNGPFHTNDAAQICAFGGESPTFGRTSEDIIEMNTAPGHYTASGCTGTVNMKGKYVTNGPTLLPPETDNELLEAAGIRFKGRTVIELKEGSPKNQMVVTTFNFSTKKFETGAAQNFPENGVIFVENEISCSLKYSPFKNDKLYEEEEKEPGVACGNVYIKGKYTESLTVASQNDVIINGNIETTHEVSGKPTGGATLGLIANNFVRLYHPVTAGSRNSRGECNSENQNSSEDPRRWGALNEPVIDAAILSTTHSWIVDNFMCGDNFGGSLGNLTVWGAIAQFWRGRVTRTASGIPYAKSYNYDDRLATNQPPNFLAPTSNSSWKVTRETQP
jgi:Tfp pilus assembly protein PilX